MKTKKENLYIALGSVSGSSLFLPKVKGTKGGSC